MDSRHAYRRGILFMLFLLVYAMFVMPFLRDGMVWVWQGLRPEATLAQLTTSPWFFVLLQLLGLLLPLVIWLLIHGETLAPHLPPMKMGKTNTLLVTGISFFMLPTMMLISLLMSQLMPNPVSELLDDTAQQALWAMVIALAVTPAVVEEVVFRGYIQSQFKDLPAWAMAALGSVFFALMHQPHQYAYAFVMGMVFAYIVYYTRSLRAGILSHFIMNAFNVVLFRGLAWLADRAEYVPAAYDMEAAEVSPWAAVRFFMVLTAVSLPIAGALFKALVTHNNQRATRYEIKQSRGA